MTYSFFLSFSLLDLLECLTKFCSFMSECSSIKTSLFLLANDLNHGQPQLEIRSRESLALKLWWKVFFGEEFVSATSSSESQLLASLCFLFLCGACCFADLILHSGAILEKLFSLVVIVCSLYICVFLLPETM